MAKKQNLEDLSSEELAGKKKTLKVLVGILTGIIIAYGVFMFYKMFTGTWDTQSPLIVFPMMLFVVLLPVNRSIKSIDDELKKRKESDS